MHQGDNAGYNFCEKSSMRFKPYCLIQPLTKFQMR